MIPFKRLTLSERAVATNFITRLNDQESTHIVLHWLDDEDAYYAIVEGMLIFRKQEDHTYIYSMPQGRGTLRYALMQVLENASVMGCKCIIRDIIQNAISDIKSAMPGHFDIEEVENGTYRAVAKKNFSNSVFNNNESMVPPPGGA